MVLPRESRRSIVAPVSEADQKIGRIPLGRLHDLPIPVRTGDRSMIASPAGFWDVPVAADSHIDQQVFGSIR